MIECQGWRKAVSVVVLCSALGACGQVSRASVEAAREAGRSQGAAQEKDRAEKESLERDVADLKEEQEELQRQVQARAGATPAAGGGKTAGGGTSAGSAGTGSGAHTCGSGVSVNSATSCSFADNVAGDWRSNGGGSSSFQSWSPVTQRWYVMRCVSGMPTVCRGGNNAVVFIR